MAMPPSHDHITYFGVPTLSVLALLSIASSSLRSVVTDVLADRRENRRIRLRRKLVPAKLYTKKLAGE